MKKITVAIPAHNAHDTIERTLFSILNQNIVNKIQVLIVDDCSETKYDYLISKYSNILDIEIIRLKHNSGPGIARRTALNACKTEYITFIDADDIYIDGLFMQGIIDYLDSNKECTNVNVMFLEELDDGRFTIHQNDVTWVFGKIYRVEYLTKNNITFSELRANEDLEFNLRVDLFQKENEYTEFINDKQVYLWKYKENSITRINDRQYSYHNGIIGALKAKMKVFKEKEINQNKMVKICLQELPYMYNSYLSIIHDKPNEKTWLNDVLEVMIEFYKKHIKNYWDSLSEKEKGYFYNNRKLNNVKHIIPSVSFNEFIKKLEGGVI